MTEFISSGGTLTYTSLAKKYGVTERQLRRRAGAEGWVGLAAARAGQQALTEAKAEDRKQWNKAMVEEGARMRSAAAGQMAIVEIIDRLKNNAKIMTTKDLMQLSTALKNFYETCVRAAGGDPANGKLEQVVQEAGVSLQLIQQMNMMVNNATPATPELKTADVIDVPKAQ